MAEAVSTQAVEMRYAPQLAPVVRPMRSVRWWLLNFLPRLLVGGLFMYTGYTKTFDAAHIQQFAKDIGHYDVAPVGATYIIAYVLPWIEIVAGGLLILGWLKPESRFLIAAMALLFLVLKAYVHAIGRKIDCGCVSKDSKLYPLFNEYGLVLNAAILALLAVEWLDSRAWRRAKRRADLENERRRAVGRPAPPEAAAIAAP